MSHPEQLEFVGNLKSAFPSFFKGGRVLEIGSLDINGSVRQFFQADEYIGLDVGPGPGVDVVCEGQKYDAPDGSFDVVISAECLEHNPYWIETMDNMFRLVRPGGLVIMTCAAPGRPEHGTKRTSPQDAPLIEWDYYRNISGSDILAKIEPDLKATEYLVTKNVHSHDTYFAAFKAGAKAPVGARQALNGFEAEYRKANRSLAAFKEAALIRLFGEERYMSGSLLPWKEQVARNPRH
jgi:SAM-dependent methyltransferase